MTYTEINLGSYIADNFPDPVAILNTSGIVIWCNQATYEKTQLTPEEIIGHRFSKLSSLSVREIPKFVRLFATLLRGKSIEPIELSWTTKDGTVIHSEARISMIKIFDDQRAVQVITRDITQVKQFMEILEGRNRKLDDFFQNANVPMFRTSLETGLVLDCNKMGSRMLGYKKPDDLIGKIRVTDHYVNDSQRLNLLDELKRKGKVLNHQIHLRKVNGDEIWAEISATPYPDDGYLESVVIDITERKTAEEQLRQSEKIFRNIIEHTSDILFNLDEKGHIIYTSPQTKQILGYEYGEMHGPWVDYTSDNPVNKNAMKITEHTYLTGEKPDKFVIELLHKNGTSRYLEVDMSPELNKEGIVIGMVGVVRHITKEKEAEEAIRSSEEKYRTLFDSIQDAIASVDINGTIIEWNNAFCELTGYSVEEFKQIRVLDITPEKWLDKERLILKEQVDVHGFSEPYEREIIRKDGTIVPIEIVSYLSRDNKGHASGYWAIVRDITERIRAEEFLRASAQRYRELLENLPAGVGITDFNENLTYVNPQFCKLLGYKNDELLGMNVLDTIASEDQNKVLNETENRKTGESSAYEIRLVRKDGSLRDVSLSAVPHRNEHGEIIGTIGLIIDITEAKQSEKAIMASEKRLKSLIEQLPLGVAIADLNERVELVNQALTEMLWQNREKLVGHNLTEYLNPDFVKKVQEQTETRKLGAKSTYEVEMIRTDGIRRDVRVFAAPNYNSSGEVIGSVGIFEDITDEKQNEAIRRQQEQEIDLYGSLLRHDLRNDLGLILSYIEAVQMLFETADEEVRSFLKAAISSVERMANLLTSFGRPQDVREVDIVEFIETIAAETQEVEKRINIIVNYSSDTRPQRITAGGLLGLVFMNLFRNAAQHAGNEPVLEVKVSQVDHEIRILVSDNGPGVSEKFQDNLFNRGTSSKGEAGGLGLYLCKEIMDRSGGSIKLLKSEKGAVFELVIPTNR